MRRNQFYIISIVVILLTGFISCEQDPEPQFHFEYFGLEEGRFVIYDVVEITHDEALGIHDTTLYQMKTVWRDVYIDNEGREGREYHIYRRDSSTGVWDHTDVWHGLYDGIRGELIEENQRKVKLVFAPTSYKEWDANAYNMDAEQQCYYRDVHGDTILNNTKLDSTLVVEMESVLNLVDDVRKYEVYQKHVGLVYKHYKDNYLEFGTPTVILGRELYMTYVSTGIE